MTIIDFYHDFKTPDGITLNDCISATDNWLEICHHYIQYCFPLREPSRYNPEAPLLDDKTISAFHNDPDMQEKLALITNRMIQFYNGYYFNVRNHNVKRISRILKSLHVLSPELYITFKTEVADKLTNYYLKEQSSLNKMIDCLFGASVNNTLSEWRSAERYQ